MNNLGFGRKTIAADLAAGVVNAVTSIPEAMASAILAGLNPIQGLYAITIGTPVGALTTGSVFMNVSITSAMALAVGDALAGYAGEAKLEAVILLTLMVGLFALLLGILKLGTLTRFVSNAVMTGFLTGVALLIILGQLGDLSGYSSGHANKVRQTVDLVLHLGQVDPHTLVTGLFTLALIVVLNRTRLKTFSMVVAMLLASLLPLLLGWDTVTLVGDVAEIPRSLPTPKLPDLALIRDLVAPAVAICVIGLTQGAGVGRSVPNPDGRFPDPSRDFVGQGVANIAAGLFQGMPVGGSLSSTAINVSAGAKTRMANLSSGLFVAGLVLLAANLVELVPMACMAAMLIAAGWETINFEEIGDVRDAGLAPRLIMIVTLLATLVVQIHVAVFVGAILSLLHFVYAAAMGIRVVELVVEDGILTERPPPEDLPGDSVTLLKIYGSLYFAAAYTLEQVLPKAGKARRPVVVLRLRGHEHLASTFVAVLERYAEQLQQTGGRLFLSGVSPQALGLLVRTETTDTIPESDIYLAEDGLGVSSRKALAAATQWLESELELPGMIAEIEGG